MKTFSLIFSTISFLIITFSILAFAVHAGNDGAAPEATAFQIHSGDVDASYTGDMYFSIPLWTLKGRGVDLPMILTYQAGITDRIVNEPGWVGEGFSLGFGSITRSVSGTPDEFKRQPIEYDCDLSGLPFRYPLQGGWCTDISIDNPPYCYSYTGREQCHAEGYLHRMEGCNGGTTGTGCEEHFGFTYPGGGPDTHPSDDYSTPDNYFLSVSGAGDSLVPFDAARAGSETEDNKYTFYTNRWRAWDVKSYITPGSLGSESDNINKWIVTAEDGTKYTFGSDTSPNTRPKMTQLIETYQEYAPISSGAPYMDPVMKVINNGYYTIFPSESALYPSAWYLTEIAPPVAGTNNKISIEYDYFNGGTYRDEYVRGSCISPADYPQLSCLETLPGNEEITASDGQSRYLVTTRSMVLNRYQRSHPSRLDTPFQDAEFVMTASGDKLDYIKINADDDSGDTKKVAKIKFYYTGNKLTKIEFYGSDYASPSAQPQYSYNMLSYYPDCTSWTGPEGSREGDVWGYCPGNPKAGSLQTIRYPTGGTVTYDYEADRYTCSMTSLVKPDIAGSCPFSQVNGGGLRLLSIVENNEMGETVSNDFTYGPGTATYVPDQIFEIGGSYFGYPFSGQFEPGFGTDSKSYVGYEWVRKTGRGSVTTYYTTAQDFPDIDLGCPGSIAECPLSSMDYKRGLVKKVMADDVQTTENQYSFFGQATGLPSPAQGMQYFEHVSPFYGFCSESEFSSSPYCVGGSTLTETEWWWSSENAYIDDILNPSFENDDPYSLEPKRWSFNDNGIPGSFTQDMTDWFAGTYSGKLTASSQEESSVEAFSDPISISQLRSAGQIITLESLTLSVAVLVSDDNYAWACIFWDRDDNYANNYLGEEGVDWGENCDSEEGFSGGWDFLNPSTLYVPSEANYFYIALMLDRALPGDDYALFDAISIFAEGSRQVSISGFPRGEEIETFTSTDSYQVSGWPALVQQKAMTDDNTITKTIQYNTQNSLPEYVTETNTGGQKRTIRTSYAFEDTGSFGQLMLSAHMLSQPWFEWTFDTTSVSENNYGTCSVGVSSPCPLLSASSVDYTQFSGNWLPAFSRSWFDANKNGYFDDTPAEIVQTDYIDYDSFGNLRQARDSSGKDEYIRYDSTYNIFPVRGWNEELGSDGSPVWKKEYDFQSTPLGYHGNIIKSYDANNKYITFGYDQYGRLNTFLPHGMTQPTVTYSYYYAGSGISSSNPNRVTTTQVVDADTQKILYAYADGMGRQKQSRIPTSTLTGSNSIVQDTIYDNQLNKVDKSSIQYDRMSSGYTTPDLSQRNVDYAYYPDALARVSAMKMPGSTVESEFMYSGDLSVMLSDDAAQLSQSASSGRTYIIVDDSTGFVPGQTITICAEHTGQPCWSQIYPPWIPAVPTMPIRDIVVITSITGNRINFDTPLTMAHNAGNTLWQNLRWDSDNSIVYNSDEEGRVTFQYYDKLGNNVKSIDAGSGITTRTFDQQGNMLTITNPAGQTTYLEYDTLNRQRRIVNLDEGASETYYDDSGNVLLSYAGNYVRNPGFEVDENSDGKPDSWEQPGCGSLTISQTYVHSGLYSGKLSNSGCTTSPYEAFSFQLPYSTPVSLGSPTEFTISGWVYVPSGTSRANRVIIWWSEVPEPYGTGWGELTVWSSESAGAWRYIEGTATVPASANYIGIRIDTFCNTPISQCPGDIWFDSLTLGRSDEATSFNEIKYSYDNANRQTKIDYPWNQFDIIKYYDGTNSLLTSNGLDRLTYISDASGVTMYKYDERGRITEEKKNSCNSCRRVCPSCSSGCTDINGDGTVNSLDFSRFSSAFGSSHRDSNFNPNADFDGNLQVDSLDFSTFSSAFGTVCGEGDSQHSYPDYFLTSYTYDDADNVKTVITLNDITTQFDYNDLNQLSEIKTSDQSVAINYQYNPEGTIDNIAFGNGITTDYTYTPRLWLESINTPISSPFQRFYEYDDTGNLMTERQGISSTSSKLADYMYDSLQRLEDVTDYGYYSGNIHYTYDSVGNRLSGEGRTYSYESGTNKLVSDSIYTYSHDGRGNIIGKTAGSSSTSYSYGSDNMLSNVIMPGGISEEYVYDANGHRTLKYTTQPVEIQYYHFAQGTPSAFAGTPYKWSFTPSSNIDIISNAAYSGNYGIDVNDQSTNSMSVTQLSEAVAGQLYTCSAYAKVISHTSGGAQYSNDGYQDLYIAFIDSTMKYVDLSATVCSTVEWCETATSTNWQSISATRTAPTGTAYVACFVNSMSNDIGETYWDDFSLGTSTYLDSPGFEGNTKTTRYSYDLFGNPIYEKISALACNIGMDDETLYGRCATQQPRFCDPETMQMTDNCQICGCSSGGCYPSGICGP